MEFNWKIVSVDDTSHTMTVDFWNAEHPNPVQTRIVAPPVGVDINEYITRFVPILTRPVISYQSIPVGVEGTGTITTLALPTTTDPLTIDLTLINTGTTSTSTLSLPDYQQEQITALVYRILEDVDASKV
jgi:hypothetical protein